eukprot:s4442_g2.t1
MERRVDPEDGRAETLDEMLLKYKGTYSKTEIEAYFRSECQLASVGKRPSAVAAAFASKDSSEINGLEQWLREVGYEQSFQKVADWCHENGAVLLEEVQENWEQVKSDLGLERGSGTHDEQAFQVPGLSAWLEEIELEDYLEDVLEWCHQHGVRALKEIQPRWEDILLELKLKTAKEQLPGKRVSVRVLKGKWQGSYMAQVLEVAATGIQIRHLEDDFEETLPLDALGGGKYLLEPVDSDDEVTGDVQELLRTGRLRVDATGAGLQLRWVKLGYAVDKVERKPGQDDIHEGDVVLAVGGSLLTGLDEDTVEERFRNAFGNGVGIVIGCMGELMKHPVDRIAEHVSAELRRVA